MWVAAISNSTGKKSLPVEISATTNKLKLLLAQI
jgi:hypothetical protein